MLKLKETMDSNDLTTIFQSNETANLPKAVTKINENQLSELDLHLQRELTNNYRKQSSVVNAITAKISNNKNFTTSTANSNSVDKNVFKKKNSIAKLNIKKSSNSNVINQTVNTNHESTL
jgi:hypothetical protein